MRRLACIVAVVCASLCACTPWVDAPGFFGPRNVVTDWRVQQALDNGNVVNVNGCQPGQCTVWLAGHRTSHGAVFANVLALGPGDVIRYSIDWRIYHYRVTHTVNVCCAGDPFSPEGDLVLQTTVSGGTVRLVYAALEWVQVIER